MRAAASASDLLDDREFAVPRELVFEAWTVPEHFARWFGPDGVEVPVCEIDARPGGEHVVETVELSKPKRTGDVRKPVVEAKAVVVEPSHVRRAVRPEGSTTIALRPRGRQNRRIEFKILQAGERP